MEVVNTLDIDGTQWEIRDKSASNKIAVIEQRNTVELKEIVKDNCYLKMAKRNGIINCYIRYKPSTNTAGKQVLLTGILPVGWRPAVDTRNLFVTNADDTYKGQMVARENGNIDIWAGVGSFIANQEYVTNIILICAD